MTGKELSFLLDGIYAAPTTAMGRGVFTKAAIAAGTYVEFAPVIVLSAAERELIDQTLLHDYIFEWGKKQEQCVVALGLVSVYNHSYDANCAYEMYFKKGVIAIKTVKPVKRGGELFINYNGTPDDEKRVWFETADANPHPNGSSGQA